MADYIKIKDENFEGNIFEITKNYVMVYDCNEPHFKGLQFGKKFIHDVLFILTIDDHEYELFNFRIKKSTYVIVEPVGYEFQIDGYKKQKSDSLPLVETASGKKTRKSNLYFYYRIKEL